ncbi:MAG: ATP-binding cassette domain-containing protein [Lachnospiraceae bacterium]
MIHANGVSVKYRKGQLDILKGINLKIQDGEMVALLGHNGSGKSTLMKCLTGVIKPTEGSIEIDGKDIFKEQKSFRTQFGVMFNQKPSFIIDLKVMDNLIFFKEMYRLDDAVFKERLKICDAYLDIQALYEKQYRKLSYGERTKCEIVSVLLHDPRYVFLDEPTNGLDIKSKKALYELLYKINKTSKATMIVVTHELEYLTEYFKRVIVLKKGEILYDADGKQMEFLMRQRSCLKVQYHQVIDGKIQLELKDSMRDMDEEARTVSYIYDGEDEKRKMIHKIINAYNIQKIEEEGVGVKEVYEYLVEKNTSLR